MNRLFWARLRHSPAALAGGLILLLILAAALAATLFYPGDPRDMVGPPNLWPGADSAFPLGTDMLGRDMAAALMHGARQSLVIAFGAMLPADGPRMITSAIVNSSVGMVRKISVKRIRPSSMRPPKKPQTTPMAVPSTTASSIAPKAITSDWRARIQKQTKVLQII